MLIKQPRSDSKFIYTFPYKWRTMHKRVKMLVLRMKTPTGSGFVAVQKGRPHSIHTRWLQATMEFNTKCYVQHVDCLAVPVINTFIHLATVHNHHMQQTTETLVRPKLRLTKKTQCLQKCTTVFSERPRSQVAEIKSLVEGNEIGMIRYTPERHWHLQTRNINATLVFSLKHV